MSTPNHLSTAPIIPSPSPRHPQAPLCCIVGEPVSAPGTAPDLALDTAPDLAPGTAPSDVAPDTAPDCSTDPSANALDGARGWRCVLRIPVRAVHPLAELCVYERVPN